MSSESRPFLRGAPFAREAAAALVGLALAASHAMAGSLTPPGPPAPTPKTTFEVQPRVPLLGPGPHFIDAPGSYYLTQDVVSPGSDPITIATSDVTLDLSGFTVRGGALGAGIRVVASGSRIVVQGGRIVGAIVGVQVGAASADVTIRDVSIADVMDTGISFSGASGTVDRCTIERAGAVGIVCEGPGRRLVTDSVVRDTGTASIAALDDGHLDVRRCLATGAARGVYFLHSDPGLPGPTGSITDCVVFGCSVGILLDGLAGPLPGVLVGRNLAWSNGLDYNFNGSPQAAPIVPLGAGPTGWSNAN